MNIESRDPRKFKEGIISINPLKVRYKKYWQEIKRKCIEGYWVDGIYMTGNLYFYANLGRILMNVNGSKTKSVGVPNIRDVEWAKSYIFTEAKGFSGFELDKEVTCSRWVDSINLAPEKEDEENAIPSREQVIKDYIRRKKLKIFDIKNPTESGGFPEWDKIKFKKYIPAREYLPSKHKKNLGKPLYYNNAKNVFDLEARRMGKSFFAAVGLILHNFLFDGANNYDDFLKAQNSGLPMSSETLVGAIDAKYTKDLLSKVQLAMDNLPGGGTFNDKYYDCPLSKQTRGTFAISKYLEAAYELKKEGGWVTKGSKSKIHNRSFADNPLAGNGTGPNLIVFEEVGFMNNLKASLGAMKDATYDGTDKFGVIWMCVCAGTKIWTKDGRLINIEDLKKSDGIIGWDEGKSEPTTVEKMFPKSLKPCVRLTTNKGTILECSTDHPILWTKNAWNKTKRNPEDYNGTRINLGRKKKWKDAGEIKINDQILAAESVPVFGTKEVWEPRMLGMLIGDGSYGFNKTPVFSNCDTALNTFVDKRFDTVVEKSYTTKKGLTYRETRIKGICQNLRSEGIYGQTKDKKTLPPSIYEANEYDVCELLAGFFDTDGTVYIGNKQRICLDSAYRNLLEEVRMLLRKIGVHGSIQFCKPNLNNPIDRNGWYRLVIADGRSLDIFSRKIKLLVDHKRDNLRVIKNTKHKCREVKGLAGLRVETINSIEDIGVREVYNLTAGDHHTYIANGIVTHNTGTGGEGDSASISEPKDVFYNPEQYDCLVFEDTYESSPNGIGYFVPYTYRLDDYRDEYGFIDLESSGKFITSKRKKLNKSRDTKALYDEMQNNPILPSEAFLVESNNIFPVAELKAHLSWVKSKNTADVVGQNGELVWVQGQPKPKWESTKRKPCWFGMSNKDDITGCIQIWEHPKSNTPFGLYVAGVDPYAQDEATSSVSLGSCIIYKTMDLSNPGVCHQPVAEYTGRPKTAVDYYENVRKLLMYYNAECLYENNINNLMLHFRQKHAIKLLAKQPTIIKAAENSSVQRQYGLHMNKQVKDEIELYLRDWLLEESRDNILNLHKIYSVPILEELVNYNKDGNFDRVIALMLCIVQKHQRYNIKVNSKKKHVIDPFFSKKLYR